MVDNGSRQPRVTIAIPCFKQEVFLFECLNSLVAQTMPDWEAVVVDDCSPAATTARIVSTYSDPRIRCIRHQVNSGLSASRNTGLQAGRSPFVLCVDADDFLHPEFLSATLDTIERRGADCAYTAFQCVGLSNEVWFANEPKSAGELAEGQWLPGPGATMRRSVWEAVGGYSTDLRYNEDWDFWIAALQLGVSVVRVPRALYFYRRHGHSMTATQPENEWITREVILKKREAFFSEGDRARTFRAGGLISAAYAHRALGHRWRRIVLTARGVAIDPKLLVSEAKGAVWRKLRIARQIERRLRWKIEQIEKKLRLTVRTNGDYLSETNVSLYWDSCAAVMHNQYGHLSHDFEVLGHVIDETEACSVLEIGCGSGRLVPVYLSHDIPMIWLQDVSERNLDLCRQRFFCQKHIHYFHRNVQNIPISVAPDLIVANRVLQHILDEDEFKQTMEYLASMTRYFYINEAGIKEANSSGDLYMKGRDYSEILFNLGCRLVEQGEMVTDSGRQRWMLFARNRKQAAKSLAPYKTQERPKPSRLDGIRLAAAAQLGSEQVPGGTLYCGF